MVYSVCENTDTGRESPVAVVDGTFGGGVGPIFLNQLNCDEDNLGLLECTSLSSFLGVVGCTHDNDVGVICPGTPLGWIYCLWSFSLTLLSADRDNCVNNTCDDNADCMDLRGTYECNCTEGYRGDGFYCEGQ